jgi:RNA polymerase sigma-70 factor (ECF subfamily)
MDVQRCLHALNETERSIVLLFYMDDRPLKEIAAIMQMPEGTVKSHLSRSKAKMAKVFN